MSLRTRFRKALDGFRLKQEEIPHIARIEIPRSRMKPFAPEYISGWLGQARTIYGGGDYIDVAELRRLSLTTTPYMCIQKLVNDVMSTQWEVIPLAKEGQEQPDGTAKEHAKTVQNWLYYSPNENHEPFAHILCKYVTDLLALDAGALNKIYASGSTHYMTQLWASDGGLYWKEVDIYQKLGKVYPNINIEGREYKNYNVGYWYNPMGEPSIPWEPHEIVYAMLFPRTDIPYGTSKIQVLKTIIGSLMGGDDYYYEFWKKGGIGSCIVGTEEGLQESVWQQWRDRIKNELQAELIKILPLDHKPFVNQLGVSPRELQWLETKEDYRMMVMALFNTPPEVHGFTQERSTAKTTETQRSIYVNRGLWPILKALEWYINTQVITEFFWAEPKERGVFAHQHIGKWAKTNGNEYSDGDVDILFRFKLYDLVGEKQQLEIDEQAMKNGLITVNEIRKRQGKKSLAWGDINPMFLLNPQQWSQSFYFRALTPESFAELTGAPAPTEMLAAVKPETNPEEDVKAYKKSRT